jgi:hypothetical protein
MYPFRKMWGAVKSFFKSIFSTIGSWFSGKGKGFWGKVGKVFGKAFTYITKSSIWTKLVNSAAFQWIKTRGATLLSKATMATGKIFSVVGWVLLFKDVMDMATVADCVAVAFQHKGDASKMPSYCDGDATKMIVAWSLERAGIAAQE